MFKLPNHPSPQADIHELADFAELNALSRGSVSIRSIQALMGRMDDNDSNVGCEDNDDQTAKDLDEMMNEIDRRREACGDGYPFELQSEGTVLGYDPATLSDRGTIYLYLLLSTRLNMLSRKVHAGIDGTGLLETVSAHALKNYLGRERARTLVFGTSCAGSFTDKVSELCRELGEGGQFRHIDSGDVDANDDRLDVVSWVPFSDKLPGKLIIFGQCKTGTNWRNEVAQLQPDAFIKRWMSDTIVVNPLRAFCISEAADRTKWRGVCVYSGILFDRCRLVDFCHDLDTKSADLIAKWSNAALIKGLFA
ncbi:MAG: hypothetical protein Q8M07_22805 [Prosthecobacter sp.]|nr:hypothetical protein [Prosthecobacter sp.]